MCGICGVVHFNPEFPIDKGMISHMTEIMRHRGPDSKGFHIAPGVGLGVQRLKIIDLQTGDQPISNEDDTVTVVCNGEIYNFIELRQTLRTKGHRLRTNSDVEVIVHLYEDYGVDCLRHLRGMFAFALWDSRLRRLMLARDRLGIKPLHYAVGKDGIYFASELKSILVTNQIERQIDINSLEEIFTLGFVTAPKTLFTNIRRLLPGHYLLFKNGTFSVHCYWEPDFSASAHENSRISAKKWEEMLLEKLEESVRIHLRSDVRVGAWLSAGIDSSSIVSLMARITNQPIETFTLTFENPDFDEVNNQKTLNEFTGYDVPNSRIMCKNEDFNLFPKALWHCEDPRAVCLEICQMVLAEFTSLSVKAVLTGEGSDEIFGGYPRYQIDKLLRPLSKIPLPLRRLILIMSWPFTGRRWYRARQILLGTQEMGLARFGNLIGAPGEKLHKQLFSAGIMQKLVNKRASEDCLVPLDQFQYWHPFVKLQYYDMKMYLPNFITHGLDRASMAYSLEARVPFLDHKLVEFCLSIPPSLKMKRLQEKYILRCAMKKLLPTDVVQRKKRALTPPFQQWLRGDLPDFAAELLSEGRLREKEYFNPDFVTHTLYQHRAGKFDYGRLLLGVLGVQLWDDLFMRGCRPAGTEDTVVPSRTCDK